MKNNTISNINFTSNIRFIPYNRYKKLTNLYQTKFVKEMSNIDEICEFEQNCATEEIIQCLAGVFMDLKNKINQVFHLYPDKLYNGLGQKLINLIQIGDKLIEMIKTGAFKGALFGGITLDNHSPSKLCLKLFNFFKKIFKACEEKDITIFFAQNAKGKEYSQPQTAFIYCKKNDTYYVNCRNGRYNYKIKTCDTWQDLLDKYEIRDHFDYIHVSPKDKVFIGFESKETIPNEFWNKTKNKKAA